MGVTQSRAITQLIKVMMVDWRFIAVWVNNLFLFCLADDVRITEVSHADQAEVVDFLL